MSTADTDFILAEVCTAYGVSVPRLLSPRREAALVNARQECARRLRATGLSLPRIGRILNRDSSSVLHLLRDRQTRGVQKAAATVAITDVCRRHGVSTGELRSRRNSAVIVAARRECAGMLRSTGMSLPQIARILHRTPHTIYNLLHSQRSEGETP